MTQVKFDFSTFRNAGNKYMKELEFYNSNDPKLEYKTDKCFLNSHYYVTISGTKEKVEKLYAEIIEVFEDYIKQTEGGKK